MRTSTRWMVRGSRGRKTMDLRIRSASSIAGLADDDCIFGVIKKCVSSKYNDNEVLDVLQSRVTDGMLESFDNHPYVVSAGSSKTARQSWRPIIRNGSLLSKDCIFEAESVDGDPYLEIGLVSKKNYRSAGNSQEEFGGISTENDDDDDAFCKCSRVIF